jgi:hypothetical protein
MYINEIRDHCGSSLSASVDIAISGHIDRELEAAIRRLYAALMGDGNFRLRLAWPQPGIRVRVVKSLGGNVERALRIGRMLRDLQASVWVEEECSSSCVFLLAGAVQRSTLAARIGIHRPYFRNLSPMANPSAVSRVYKQHRQRITRFLTDMNVPVSLVDAMDAIPTEQAHYLTRAELKFYRLDEADPAFQERLNARNDALRDITSAAPSSLVH